MSRIENIYNWYSENIEADPNMFELIDALAEVSNLPGDDKENINQLVNIEITRLYEKGIVENEYDPLVRLVVEFQQKALTKEEVSPSLAEYARMVAGISFWIKTQLSRKENKEDFQYDNFHEYADLLKKERALRQSGEELGLNLKQLAEFIAGKFKTDNKDIEESIRGLQVATGGYSKSPEEQEMAAMFDSPYDAEEEEKQPIK